MRPILFLGLFALAAPGAAQQYAVPMYNEQGLYTAVQKGDGEGVRRMLSHGVDANFRTMPPLLVVATQKDYGDVVAALLEGGADPDQKDNDTRTALVYAARDGRTRIAAMLLAKGADPNARNDYPRRYITFENPSPHLYFDNQVTALMYAAKGGYTAIVDALAAKGAKVNASAYYGETALMFAAGGGHTRTALRLLELGADLHASADDSRRVKEAQAFGASYGGTPLLYAVRGKHGETARALLAKYGGHAVEEPKSVYYYALFASDVALLEALAARGIDPPDDDALRAAAAGGSREVLGFVLDRRKRAGRPLPASILTEAAGSGSLEKVKVLVERGANVNARDNRGQNALFYAVYKGAPDVVAYLLDHGIETNVAGGSLGYQGMGETALAMAVQKGDVAVVKMLLAKGADPNFRSKEMSALDVAKQLGRTDLVLLLGGAGQPVDASLRGKSTYHESPALPFGALFRSGGLLYETMCLKCHGREGNGAGASIGAFRIGKPSRDAGIAAVLLGVKRQGTIPMEEYESQLLDTEAAAILTYLDSARNGSTQASFQPADIAAVRKAAPTRAQDPLIGSDASSRAAVRQLALLGYLYSESVFVEAVRARDQKAVELFLAAGMSPAARHATGQTAMYVAASTDNVEALRVLAERGADLNMPNAPWAGATTPVFAAVENCRGRRAALAYMLDHGVNVNHRFGEWTLLMKAASNGCIESSKLLVDRGADVNARLSSGGWTALRLAKAYGGGAAVPVLLAAGARE